MYLDRSFGFNVCDGCVDIFRNNVSAIEHAASHVFSMTWVAFYQSATWLETGVSYVADRKHFMESFFCRYNRSVGGKRKVNPRIGNKVGLEFRQINVQGSFESERCSNGRNNLSNQSIQVGVDWSFYIQVVLADLVYCFIVDHERTISVFQSSVSSED